MKGLQNVTNTIKADHAQHWTDENGDYLKEAMDKWQVTQWVHHFEALIPVYVRDWGHGTLICLKSGERLLDKRSCSKLVNDLFRYFGMSVPALREAMDTTPGMRELCNPLPLTPDIVLQPLKLRIPRIRKKDMANGYVVLSEIKRVVPPVNPRVGRKERMTILEMNSSHTITTLCSYKTTCRKLAQAAWKVERFFQTRTEGGAMIILPFEDKE